MKRALALATMIALVASQAHAEDAVVFSGNYYKERSTRVISPTVVLKKDLPHEIEAEVKYLVDQITSASGAFTVTDEAFQEYRNEIGVAASIGLLDVLRPGFSVRYSHEGDYRSLTYGADVSLSLFDDTTTLSARVQRQNDTVLQRGREGFRDTLDTTYVGVSLTRILLPQLIAGTTFEAQFLNGYTENPYRVEQHPRERNRYSLGVWGAYRIAETATTLRAEYCFSSDTWDLVAHAFALQITQRVTSWLSVSPRFRIHTQTEVFFTDLTPDGFRTTDPKLDAFGARSYGLAATFALPDLGPLQRLELMPAYTYYDQDTRYGPAHIAQLGVYYPF